MGFPHNWSQRASDNLMALGRMAASSARNSPGSWVNPLSPLRAEIRYDSAARNFEIRKARTDGHVLTFYREDMRQAGEELAKEHWGRELYAMDGSASAPIVEQLLGALGSMARGH